jgi:hypothetical protein
MTKILEVNSDYTVSVGANSINLNAGNIIATGDFQVLGTMTTVDSTDLTVTDNVIVLNSGEVGAGVTLGTAGINVDRGSSDTASVIWNETTDAW